MRYKSTYWYVMNVGTDRPYGTFRRGHHAYRTQPAAKAQCTRLNKQYGNTPQWVVMSGVECAAKHPVKMVERINLMSGLPFMEPEDTPLFMSPASETYWSM